MKINKSIGRLDIYKYLCSKEGIIEIKLIDAGMIRIVSSNYEFELIDDKVRIKKIMSRGKNTEAYVNRYVELTPNFLVFIGMYDGDGNKTNNIGFGKQLGITGP